MEPIGKYELDFLVFGYLLLVQTYVHLIVGQFYLHKQVSDFSLRYGNDCICIYHIIKILLQIREVSILIPVMSVESQYFMCPSFH